MPGTRAAAAAEIHATEAVPRVLRLLGTVVAPTTLLTALLFYFGRLHVTGMCRYLGISYTVLGLSPEDYLVRSVDGLFVPAATAAGLVLAALWARALLLPVLPSPVQAALSRHAAMPVLLAGAGLLVLPVVVVLGADASRFPPEVPGLSLAVGAILMVGGARLARRQRPASAQVVVTEWAAAFVLVAAGLFWAVGNYAIGVGTTRGQQIEAGLASSSDLVLYSAEDLGLAGPGITAAACGGDPATPDGHRYTGLKLVLESGERLLVLPAGWTRAQGAAIVLMHTDAMSLTFAAPGTAQPGPC